MTHINKRLYLGGLQEPCSTDEIEKLFNKFGVVSNVNVSVKRDSKGELIHHIPLKIM